MVRLPSLPGSEDIVGDSAEMRRVLERVERRWRRPDATVASITGRPGTGKELWVARGDSPALAARRGRSCWRQSACGDSGDTACRSGARQARARRVHRVRSNGGSGRFLSWADRGTMFLDEICCDLVCRDAWSPLLRAVQERGARAAGRLAHRVKVDVRIVAGRRTAMISRRTSRLAGSGGDLFYQHFNVFPVHVPRRLRRSNAGRAHRAARRALSAWRIACAARFGARSARVGPQALRGADDARLPGELARQGKLEHSDQQPGQ